MGRTCRLFLRWLREHPSKSWVFLRDVWSADRLVSKVALFSVFWLKERLLLRPRGPYVLYYPLYAFPVRGSQKLKTLNAIFEAVLSRFSVRLLERGRLLGTREAWVVLMELVLRVLSLRGLFLIGLMLFICVLVNQSCRGLSCSISWMEMRDREYSSEFSGGSEVLLLTKEGRSSSVSLNDNY